MAAGSHMYAYLAVHMHMHADVGATAAVRA